MLDKGAGAGWLVDVMSYHDCFNLLLCSPSLQNSIVSRARAGDLYHCWLTKGHCKFIARILPSLLRLDADLVYQEHLVISSISET